MSEPQTLIQLYDFGAEHCTGAPGDSLAGKRAELQRSMLQVSRSSVLISCNLIVP